MRLPIRVRWSLLWLAVLWLALPATLALGAERAWIKGEVRLNLRSGPGTAYRIISGAGTGDSVTVLQRNKKWTLVRHQNGKEGWIPAGYLEAQPPAAVRLARLEKEAIELRQQLETSQTEASQLRESNTSLASTDGTQKTEIDRLTRENYELRAGARWPEWITGALILSTGMALGAVLRSMSGRNRRGRIKL